LKKLDLKRLFLIFFTEKFHKQFLRLQATNTEGSQYKPWQ